MSLSRPVVLAVLAVAGLVLLAANGHMIYVALTTQPDCVAHLRADSAGPTPGRFAAAKPSC
ncbi:hypothetical protein ACMT1E_01390 [Sphingomonas flavalba]|uniref:hypothetical protein n=1 Tax=Sphingomonas flavalba TaxID=2559804 RepID=UPI0039E1727D